jgi:hypothetical protein
MQFIIPQFLDVEDKVIGPISVRQFVIILVGAGAIFLNYELIANLSNNFWVFLVVAIFIGLFTFVIAFIRINGRPFHYFLINLFTTMKEPRLRIWNKEQNTAELSQKAPPTLPTAMVPMKKAPTASKLAVLSLVVDTGGAFHALPGNQEPAGITVDRPNSPLS